MATTSPSVFQELKELLQTIPDDSEDTPELQAAVACVERMRAQGLEPTLVSTFTLEAAEGYCISGTTRRELRFGPHVFASWSFPMSGHTGQFITGFFIECDMESPPVPTSFLEAIGLDLSEAPIDGFPESWEDVPDGLDTTSGVNHPSDVNADEDKGDR